MYLGQRWHCDSLSSNGLRWASVCGGAGGYGTRIYWSYASPLSTSASTRQFSPCVSDKFIMQNLNDRLAVYLDKVSALEASNGKLELQIREHLEKSTPVERKDLDVSFGTINDLREQITDCYSVLAQLNLQIDSAKLELHDYEIKFDQEVNIRLTVESELDMLQRRQDDVALIKGDLEFQVSESKEEIELLTRDHEEELQSMYSLMPASVNVEMDCADSADLNQELQCLREQCVMLVQNNRHEIESWFQSKVDMLKTQVTVCPTGSDIKETDFANLTRTFQDLTIELQYLQAQTLALEQSEVDMSGQRSQYLAQLQLHVDSLEAKLLCLRADTDQQAALYQQLLDLKTRLELEITEYRRLLDGEGVSASTSSITSAVTSNCVSRSETGIKTSTTSYDVSTIATGVSRETYGVSTTTTGGSRETYGRAEVKSTNTGGQINSTERGAQSSTVQNRGSMSSMQTVELITISRKETPVNNLNQISSAQSSDNTKGATISDLFSTTQNTAQISSIKSVANRTQSKIASRFYSVESKGEIDSEERQQQINLVKGGAHISTPKSMRTTDSVDKCQISNMEDRVLEVSADQISLATETIQISNVQNECQISNENENQICLVESDGEMISEESKNLIKIVEDGAQIGVQVCPVESMVSCQESVVEISSVESGVEINNTESGVEINNTESGVEMNSSESGVEINSFESGFQMTTTVSRFQINDLASVGQISTTDSVDQINTSKPAVQVNSTDCTIQTTSAESGTQSSHGESGLVSSVEGEVQLHISEEASGEVCQNQINIVEGGQVGIESTTITTVNEGKIRPVESVISCEETIVQICSTGDGVKISSTESVQIKSPESEVEINSPKSGVQITSTVSRFQISDLASGGQSSSTESADQSSSTESADQSSSTESGVESISTVSRFQISDLASGGQISSTESADQSSSTESADQSSSTESGVESISTVSRFQISDLASGGQISSTDCRIQTTGSGTLVSSSVSGGITSNAQSGVLISVAGSSLISSTGSGTLVSTSASGGITSSVSEGRISAAENGGLMPNLGSIGLISDAGSGIQTDNNVSSTGTASISVGGVQMSPVTARRTTSASSDDGIRDSRFSIVRGSGKTIADYETSADGRVTSSRGSGGQISTGSGGGRIGSTGSGGRISSAGSGGRISSAGSGGRISSPERRGRVSKLGSGLGSSVDSGGSSARSTGSDGRISSASNVGRISSASNEGQINSVGSGVWITSAEQKVQPSGRLVTSSSAGSGDSANSTGSGGRISSTGSGGKISTTGSGTRISTTGSAARISTTGSRGGISSSGRVTTSSGGPIRSTGSGGGGSRDRISVCKMAALSRAASVKANSPQVQSKVRTLVEELVDGEVVSSFVDEEVHD